MSKLVFCEEWGEKLAARHPEDLSPAEQAHLHQHLRECSQCAAAYAAFNALETRIRKLPQAGPLPSILPRLQGVQQDPAPSSALSSAIISTPGHGDASLSKGVSNKGEEDVELVVEQNPAPSSTSSPAIRSSLPGTCIFQIHARGDARLSEIVSHEVEATELAVEDVMCNVLLHLFGGGIVEDVTIQFFSDSQQQRHFSIQIYLQCAYQQFVLFPPTKESMQREVEKHTRLLLRELFVSLEIDSVELVRTPWMYENDSDETSDTGDIRHNPNASWSW